MKIVHGITLATISAFILIITCRFRTLQQIHYMQLLVLSLFVSALYFLPLIYIGWLAFQRAGNSFEKDAFEEKGQNYAEWEKAMMRFADWFFMLLDRSDLGKGGIVVSIMVHI